jgi:hypothetical protein
MLRNRKRIPLVSLRIITQPSNGAASLCSPMFSAIDNLLRSFLVPRTKTSSSRSYPAHTQTRHKCSLSLLGQIRKTGFVHYPTGFNSLRSTAKPTKVLYPAVGPSEVARHSQLMTTIATLLTSTGILLNGRLHGGGINSFGYTSPKRPFYRSMSDNA